jgi:glyoxylase-like metal-dependent hydrolase (beta-lactamase superfamily II)
MATQPISSLPKNIKNGPPANPFAGRKYGELHRVTDRVYILRNITNSSFVVGDRSVAVIDTQVNMPSAAELLRLVRSVTDKPIEYVINTHYHWDHTNGNALFKKEGATVVSSKLTKEFMVVRAPRQKEFLAGRGFELGEDPFLPERTFEGSMELDLGGMPLQLFFAGEAESDDATAIHVPQEGVLMSGDTIMTGSFPIFGQPVWDEGLEGDGKWQKTIARLLETKPAHIIPGHGPLAYDKEIRLLLRIEDYFTEEVGALVRKGLGAEAALKDLEPRLPDWITSIPVVWGNPRYAILRVWRGLTKKKDDRSPGWQQFKPTAIPQLAQMAQEAREGGDTALTLSILKNTLKESPEDPNVYSAYAEALVEASKKEASVLEKGDFFQEARGAWEKALTLDGAHVPTLLGKGRYLTMMAYRGGDDPRAGMALLRKAAELSPSGRARAEAEFYLGMGYRRLADETRAKEQFEKALAFDPAFQPARMAMA